MTPQQSECLHFIDSYMREHRGVAPSVEEIRVRLGVASKSNVVRITDGLVDRGYLRKHKGRMRALEVLRLPGEPARPLSRPAPTIPSPARKPLRLTDIADHIAAQQWCTADAETVLASLRELRQ